MSTALLVGATGLVGGHCLRLLLGSNRYDQVVVIARRSVGQQSPKLLEKVIDFEHLQQLQPIHIDDAFCALGTTIRKAGSQPAFRKVDFEYVKFLAEWSHAAGTTQFLLVSSVGADPHSRNFYLRVKGETEVAVGAIGFRSVHIFRPSFLIGNRAEHRSGEAFGIAMAKALQFAFVGPLRRYHPIAAETVARAMLAAAKKSEPGTRIYHYDEITALAA
jgi:uncharacterized protein YbjT (DUF2867 family)